MSYTRRRFLQRTLHASAALATIGLERARGDGSNLGNTAVCKDLLAGGELVGTLRFEDENDIIYDERWQHVSGGGLVDTDMTLTMEDLTPFVRPQASVSNNSSTPSFERVPFLPMISLPDAASRLMAVDVFRRVSIY